MSIHVFIQQETPKALLCLVDGKSRWLPKSQITITARDGYSAHLEVPQWLLDKPLPAQPCFAVPTVEHDPDDGQAWSKRKRYQLRKKRK